MLECRVANGGGAKTKEENQSRPENQPLCTLGGRSMSVTTGNVGADESSRKGIRYNRREV
jgi:hypothetical protein